MRFSLLYILPIVLISLLSSCDETRVFEKNHDLKSSEWASIDTVRFEVDIADTDPKNVYLNVRHSFDFGWRNAWINLLIDFPNDSSYSLPVNIPLSQPDGQWFGKCTGDICNMQYPITTLTDYSFEETGLYTFSLIHEMREDPLKEMLSTGIRIENAVKPE